MKILYLDSVGSTQTYLKQLLKDNKIYSPYAVVSNIQTDGLGSRNNIWVGQDGNLFLSFAYPISELPEDLKLESASIYFAYIFKEILCELGSSVWMKWPNDFYIKSLKVGGVITNIFKNNLICGIGLNIKNSPENFGIMDIKISKDELLKRYFDRIEKKVLWKQVFSNYKLEFHLNQNFFTHNKDEKVSLKDAILLDDGTIIVNNERIFSLR